MRNKRSTYDTTLLHDKLHIHGLCDHLVDHISSHGHIRGTQRFVSGNICPKRPKSPEIFGSNRNFLWRNFTSDFCSKGID